ncbi:hypothetical protein HHI36_018539 [Cryptolaemus montrouzieri]|uniref:Uncharacterized protein n=1 Tax=Cryptolaemus montrouzieri TaxID=559131 RepID=A0ABD2P1G4_9CUCU
MGTFLSRPAVVLQESEDTHRGGFRTIHNDSRINQNDGLEVFLSDRLEYVYSIEYMGEARAIVLNVSSCVGDINIDIAANTEDSEQYLDILSENNFVSLVNDYTRVTPVTNQ